jgi:hypothetical protein
MRRLLRSRPLVSAVLALHVMFVGGQACAMAPAAHVHGASPAAAAMESSSGDASHAHHHADAATADAGAARAGAGPAGERSPGGDGDGRCAAAISCGVAPLASGSFALPGLPFPGDRLEVGPALRLRSALPEPESPPPRR